MNKPRRFGRKLRLTLLFAAGVLLLLLITLGISLFCAYLLFQGRFFADSEPDFILLAVFSLVGLTVGIVAALLLGRLPLLPLRRIMNAVDQIADGDFSARLHLRQPEELRQLSAKFNHMAEELSSVELLRKDFINNFSHEFKTPIVSIRGFAKMLRLGDLTPEEQEEYLGIIIDESERLSELSASVLQLSQLKQQSIVTDRKRFNVSEQIRLVIAMLDSKWPEKKINFQFDCGEIYLFGSEELLKQVWINLLDNAIKFSPQGGTVTIEVRRRPRRILFAIGNEGDPIPPKAAAHIFDKFYQADTSHTTKGNGLGLAIAERIVELHKGVIYLNAAIRDRIVFEVILPSGDTPLYN